MKYVSGRDGLQVGGEVRNYGDPVPEAATWPNLRAYLAGRFVLEVPNDWEPPTSQTPEVAANHSASDKTGTPDPGRNRGGRNKHVNGQPQ